MSQKAWTAAAVKFRKKRRFPRNWRSPKHVGMCGLLMGCFNDGFLAGYDASNRMWSKKRK